MAFDPFKPSFRSSLPSLVDLCKDGLDQVLILHRTAFRLPAVLDPVVGPDCDAFDRILAVGHDEDVLIWRAYL